MFYVLDSTGAQSLYELDRLRLEAAREEIRSEERAQVARISGIEQPLLAGLEQPPSANPSQPGSAEISAPNTQISMAGAGVIRRGQEGDVREQHISSAGTEKERNDRARYEKRPVTEILAPSAIHEEKLEEQQSPSAKRNPYFRLDEPQVPREKAILAKQIMTTTVISVGAESLTSEARKIFKEKRFRHLPVLSKEGRLVGILSDRDFIDRPVMSDYAKDAMTTNVLTARPETQIRIIASVMFKERIGAMPIVDSESRLVGILTRSDILRTLVNQAPLELWV